MYYKLYPGILAVLLALLLTSSCSGDFIEVTDHDAADEHRVLEPSPVMQPIEGSYIVVMRDEAPAVDMEHVAARHQVRAERIYRSAVQGFSFQGSSRDAAALQADPGVAYVEQDFEIQALAQTVPTGVARLEVGANRYATVDGSGERVDVDVAIIDTGIDRRSADLDVVSGVDCSSGAACTGLGDLSADDDHGHGTHVAGTVAALDNAQGVVGVAPGARLHAVKVLGADGRGTMGGLVAAIDWVTAHADQIEVANMSLGGVGCSQALHAAVRRSVAAGIVYTVASGNSGADIFGNDGKLGTCDDYVPAAYPEVATISAMVDTDGLAGASGPAHYWGEDDSFAGFSNFGAHSSAGQPVVSPGGAIDLVLPGTSILSICPGGQLCRASGTSMAAPHAAGLAALYIADRGRAYSADQVFQLRQGLIDAGRPQSHAHGLIHGGDPDSLQEPLGWAPALIPAYRVEAEAAQPVQQAYRLQTVRHRTQVCNTGASTDTYTLTTQSIWPSRVSPDQLQDLPADSCAQIHIEHRVPARVRHGDEDTGSLWVSSAHTSTGASFVTRALSEAVVCSREKAEPAGAPSLDQPPRPLDAPRHTPERQAPACAHLAD